MDKTEPFVANIDNIIAARDYPTVIRMAALRLKQEGYLSVGSFLKSCSDEDLQLLNGLCDAVYTEAEQGPTRKETLAMMVLTTVLTLGEGTVELTIENSAKFFSATITFIALESMWRKGLIELDHDALSYVDDTALVARLKT